MFPYSLRRYYPYQVIGYDLSLPLQTPLNLLSVNQVQR